MEAMLAFLQAFGQGTIYIFSWPIILIFLSGTLLGYIFGAIPGIGSITAIVILLPITFGMDPLVAFTVLMSIQGAVGVGGSISSILFNVPGTSENIATTFEGYALTKKGLARNALGISAASSFLGGLLGFIAITLLIPATRKFILSFGPPEFFFMSILGLTAIASFATKNVLKGLVTGGMGLLLSFVGYDSIAGVPRYTFGTNALWDGIGQIPMITGLYGVAEALTLFSQTGVGKKAIEDKGSVITGIIDTVRQWRILISSSAIGTIIGIIPGVGGATSTTVAYATAMNTSKNPERYGTGIPEGLVASEASINSKDMGMMLPTLAFGIPGSTVCVLILAALILHGVQPGPELLTTKLNLTGVMMAALFMGNGVGCVLTVLFAAQMARVAYLRAALLAPFILVMVAVGAYTSNGRQFDVVVALFFGVLGYFMNKLGYQRISLALGLILGGLAEHNYRMCEQIWDNGLLVAFSRPISLALMALIVFSLSYPLIQHSRLRRERQMNTGKSEDGI